MTSKVEPVWITEDGSVVPLSKLTNRRLSDTLRFLVKNAKTKAGNALARAATAGNFPVAGFSWRDFLPRLYDQLLLEYRSRKFGTGKPCGPAPSDDMLEMVDRLLAQDETMILTAKQGDDLAVRQQNQLSAHTFLVYWGYRIDALPEDEEDEDTEDS